MDVICELLGSPSVLSEVRVAHHSSVMRVFFVVAVACLGYVYVVPNATSISGLSIIDCRFGVL